MAGYQNNASFTIGRDVFVFLPMGSRKSLCNSILTYTFESPRRPSQAESIQMTPNRLTGAILMPLLSQHIPVAHEQLAKGIEPFLLTPDAVSDHSVVFIRAGYKTISEQTLGRIGRRVWEIGWGGSLPSKMYEICNY